MGALDMSSGTPLYQQLADELMNRIRDRDLSAEQRLPSELELSEYYHVSRITVRKAVEGLVSAGVLEKRQGKGTFILPPKAVNRSFDDGLSSFTNTCKRSNMTPGAKLLNLEFGCLPSWASSFLLLPNNENGIIIQRIRYADDVPVIFETSYFPASFGFLLNESMDTSLHEILKRHSFFPVTCSTVLDVCLANAQEAEHLQIYQGKPLLLMRGHYADAKKRPIYASKDIVVPDRFKYTIISRS